MMRNRTHIFPLALLLAPPPPHGLVKGDKRLPGLFPQQLGIICLDAMAQPSAGFPLFTSSRWYFVLRRIVLIFDLQRLFKRWFSTQYCISLPLGDLNVMCEVMKHFIHFAGTVERMAILIASIYFPWAQVRWWWKVVATKQSSYLLLALASLACTSFSFYYCHRLVKGFNSQFKVGFLPMVRWTAALHGFPAVIFKRLFFDFPCLQGAS